MLPWRSPRFASLLASAWLLASPCDKKPIHSANSNLTVLCADESSLSCSSAQIDWKHQHLRRTKLTSCKKLDGRRTCAQVTAVQATSLTKAKQEKTNTLCQATSQATLNTVWRKWTTSRIERTVVMRMIVLRWPVLKWQRSSKDLHKMFWPRIVQRCLKPLYKDGTCCFRHLSHVKQESHPNRKGHWDLPTTHLPRPPCLPGFPRRNNTGAVSYSFVLGNAGNAGTLRGSSVKIGINEDNEWRLSGWFEITST